MNRWNCIAANAAIADCLEIVNDRERQQQLRPNAWNESEIIRLIFNWIAMVSSLAYSIWFPQHWSNLLRDFRQNCCCSCRVELRCQWVNRPYSAPNWSNRTWCNQYPTTNRWQCHLLRDVYFSMHFWRDESEGAHKWLRSQEAHRQSTIQRYCRNGESND